MRGTPSRRRRFIRTVIVLSVLAIGVPFSLSQLGSTSDARFGASAELGPNQLAAATLSVGPGRGTLDLTVIGMAPGDEARGRIDVVNDGTLPLRYSLSAAFVGTSAGGLRLADQLLIELWHATTCASRPPTTSSVLTPKQILGDTVNLFGTPATGQDPGDRILDVDRTDTLCYRIQLPLDAANGVAGQTVLQQFVVDAEHAIERSR